MPSDPHSFDELKLPFIFVPHGEEEPPEVRSGHADWIKLPATLEMDDGGEQQAAQSGGARLQGKRSRPVGSSGSPGPRRSGPSAGHPAAAEARATPDIGSISSDPIAAYRSASDALGVAPNNHERQDVLPPERD